MCCGLFGVEGSGATQWNVELEQSAIQSWGTGVGTAGGHHDRYEPASLLQKPLTSLVPATKTFQHYKAIYGRGGFPQIYMLLTASSASLSPLLTQNT